MLMWHEGKAEFKLKNVPIKQMVALISMRARRAEDCEKKFIDFVAQRSGQSTEQIEKWGEEEREFTASEAKKCGLVDKVIL